MNTCAFTGHRPKGLGYGEQDPRCANLKRRLRAEIVSLIQEGVTHFLTGMAQGVDIYAAELVLALKAEFPDITLECVIPCETQPIGWPISVRNRYFSIAANCDKETMLQTRYTPDCMAKRNQYMVDHADIILAVWNGRPSGTGQTVWYAQAKKKAVRIMAP